MATFKKGDASTKELFKNIYDRLNEINEAYEWFDGSEGEQELIEESKMLSNMLKAFYEVHGVTASNWYRFDC